ncbi:MAG: hypothetical protein KAJ75_04360 [Alphaproteobacteria bacterium]|nr:hypothetical protein [Alphaproteobacteria bacterium]
MKYISIVIAVAFIVTASNKATAVNRFGNEYANYGVAAGAALACGAKEEVSKYNLIIGWIIYNKSQTETEKRNASTDYAKAIKRAYNRQKTTSPMSCDEVLSRFNSQPIFNSEIKSDGTIIFPDGKVLKSKVKSQTNGSSANKETKPYKQSKPTISKTKNIPTQDIRHLSRTLKSSTSRTYRYGSIKPPRK